MPRIRITDRAGEQRFVDLDPARRYTVGRTVANDVVLSDPALSRLHAELYHRDGSWWLADLDSSNGTFVDGGQLEAPLQLTGTTRATLGACMIDFVPDRATRSRATLPDWPLVSEGTIRLKADEGTREIDPPGEVAALRRRLRIVERANLELLASEPLDALLPKVVDLVFEAVDPERAALVRLTEDGDLDVAAFRGDDESRLAISQTIARAVIDEHTSVLAVDAQADTRFADGHSINLQGLRGVMAAPLWDRKEVIGLLYADSRLAGHGFDEDDLRLLTMLANVAAIQIENALLFQERLEKQRFEREAHAAAEIQQRLLPSEPPAVPGYRILGDNQPCYEVGGDYFDWAPTDGQRHALVLADVSGKGMGAALLMACLQATFQACVHGGSGLRELTRDLIRTVERSAPANCFATVFLAELDPIHHRLRWANLGHVPPALLVKATGGVKRLTAFGPPAGMLPDFDHPTNEEDLASGDLLFVCSDGLTDVENVAGEPFGLGRLEELLGSVAGKDAEQVRGIVEEHVTVHGQGATLPDDLTLLLLQRES